MKDIIWRLVALPDYYRRHCCTTGYVSSILFRPSEPRNLKLVQKESVIILMWEAPNMGGLGFFRDSLSTGW